MRGWWVMTLLALASCGEHRGWNPNYHYGATPYGRYLVAREAALTHGSAAPQTIPVARPVEAPGPEKIAGRSPVPVPRTMGARSRFGISGVGAARKAPAARAAAPVLPVTTSGPFPGSTPVLVRYAFAADHPIGRAIYGRPGASAAAAARACAGFADANAAQTAFLAAGGPRQDPRGLDPDGDGFVCGWDPAPFRSPQL